MCVCVEAEFTLAKRSFWANRLVLAGFVRVVPYPAVIGDTIDGPSGQESNASKSVHRQGGELYTSRQALVVFRADFPRFGFLEGPVRVWVPRFQALWSQDVGDGPVDPLSQL